MSEREKMAAGQWYSCIDPELAALRDLAQAGVHEHNTLPPDRRGNISPKLARRFAGVGRECRIEAPFYAAYCINISLGDRVFLNAGCTILDTAAVKIGAGSLLGPGVQIYCAEHHKDPVERAKGQEIAKPVIIGQNVWIGGGAIILAGVTIGENAIVGAGSVVTRDVASGATVVGNPARVVS